MVPIGVERSFVVGTDGINCVSTHKPTIRRITPATVTSIEDNYSVSALNIVISYEMVLECIYDGAASGSFVRKKNKVV
jgi:hypothetical protein